MSGPNVMSSVVSALARNLFIDAFNRLIPALRNMASYLAKHEADVLSDQCAELADALTVYRDGELAKAGL